MLGRRGFSYSTVDKALINMRLGIRPAHRISDRLSDEDIERALRAASVKVFGEKPCLRK